MGISLLMNIYKNLNFKMEKMASQLESQVFNIDAIDRSIIEIIQKEPALTHTEIAKRVDRSQPTIG
ncbi:MAG: winged helix-turn-helix transcriptional regulator, partial [Candidatus Lokiarchaeota archaeon]|nr:winged helix-turn-helix transcriptional regulator [Candidatus Lokiarchaeota archaeon]